MQKLVSVLLLLTFGFGQNYSLYFDGDFDGVEIIFPDVNVEDFIISFDFKTNFIQEDMGLNDIMVRISLYNEFGDGEDIDTNIGGYVLGTYLPGKVFATPGWGDVSIYTENTYNDNNWHNVKIVRNYSNQIVETYVDGLKVSSCEVDNYSTLKYMSIGDRGGHEYTGYIDNLSLYLSNSIDEDYLYAKYNFNTGVGNTLYDITGNNDGTIFNATWSVDTPALIGCTNPGACNYDSDASEDDGSCLYFDCSGECGGSAIVDECGECAGDNSSCTSCTDSEACNYDSEALFDDGSCLYGDDCDGCTNSEAVNYDEDAVFDDGSCIVPDIIVPDDYFGIQAALSAASSNQTIFVRSGIYYEHNIIWPTIENLQLIGEDMETTIIDGEENGQVFIIVPQEGVHNDNILNLETVISGFTIQNGNAYGGITGYQNNGRYGGGMFVKYASPTLRNLNFYNNRSYTSGGGLYLEYWNQSENNVFVFSNLNFYNNSAESDYGGAYIKIGNGCCTNASSLELENVKFIHNVAEGSYGGLYIDMQNNENLSIHNSLFSENEAGYTSALGVSNPSIYSIVNSVFILNEGQVTLSSSNAILINSIMYNNSDNTAEYYIYALYNCLVTNYIYSDNICFNCLDLDPSIFISESGEYSLDEGSACVDAGTNYVEYNGEIIYELSPDEYEGFAPDIGPWETSQMFTPDPIITNIKDIDSDQGGRVYLDIQRSFHDKEGMSRVESYQIDRLDDDNWVGVATQNAYNDSTYRVEVTTLVDSSSTANGLSNFRVIANMEEGNFVSETVSGYSVDNIHPTVPSLASAEHDDNEVSLNWDYTLEEDFNYHEITGLSGTSYSTENTFSFNLDINDEHRINSVDSNDNQSSDSQSLLSRSLHAGANLISFNVLPEDISVANVFESIETNATGVITEGGAATQIAPGVWVGSLTEISAQKGYWVILSEDDILLLIGTPTDRNLTYNLHAGANLISFPYRYSSTISEALEDGCEAFISGVITEGGAASQIASGMWVGSLTDFKATKGYWVVIAEDCALTFENGCDELDCAPLARENQTIPTLLDYEYNQSTKQAFYFFDTIENIKEGDYLLSFNGDKLTGVRKWQGSVIDVPVMGYDGNSYSDGYIEAGSIPSFKLLSDGELTLLDGDIPAWSDNGIFMVSNLSQVIIPDEYSLSQAYPNPFNPKTTLSFAMPVDNEVTLSIYNLQGREVARLIEGNMSAGYHSVVWDANAYSSGVYFVKMMSGNYTNTQKLMLIK